MPFSALGLSPSLCAPLARLGYTQPTPVQIEAIPIVLTGSDLLARAQTGTGKTAAFGLPMIDRLLVRGPRPTQLRKPRGLILVPTRELAVQVHKAMGVLRRAGASPYDRHLRRRVAARPDTGAPARRRHCRRDAGTSHRPYAAAHDRFVGGGDSHPRRRRSHARHGLSAGAPPHSRRAAAHAPDAAVLGDVFGRRRTAVGATSRATPSASTCPKARSWRQTVSHRIYPVSDGRKSDLLKHVLTEAPVGPGARLLPNQARIEPRR